MLPPVVSSSSNTLAVPSSQTAAAAIQPSGGGGGSLGAIPRIPPAVIPPESEAMSCFCGHYSEAVS